MYNLTFYCFHQKKKYIFLKQIIERVGVISATTHFHINPNFKTRVKKCNVNYQLLEVLLCRYDVDMFIAHRFLSTGEPVSDFYNTNRVHGAVGYVRDKNALGGSTNINDNKYH